MAIRCDGWVWCCAPQAACCASFRCSCWGTDSADWWRFRPGHKLETRGIYGVVRNPSYLGLLVSSLGWVLAFRSAVGVILIAALLVPLIARIHAEERLLREHFGAEYDTYCAHTWRLVPWIY